LKNNNSKGDIFEKVAKKEIWMECDEERPILLVQMIHFNIIISLKIFNKTFK